MPIKYNPETREFEEVNENSGGVATGLPGVDQKPLGMDYVQEMQWQQNQQQLRANEIEQAAIAQGGDNRPMFGGIGETVRDIGRVTVNAGAALVTDYADLAHGVADIAYQTGQAATGNGFDGGAVFDDSDNPLTRARREAFKTETKAGQMASHVVRGVVALLTLPKFALKGIAMPLKLLGKAKVPLAGRGAKNLLNLQQKINKGRSAGSVSTAMKGLELGNDGRKAAKIASNTEWLSGTLSDVAKASGKSPELNMLNDGLNAIKSSATQLTRSKSKVRTISEALAWDAFVGFNMAGEGDYDMDETFSDMLESFGMPNLPIFQTDPLQSGITAKFKLMGEGLIFNAGFSAVMDSLTIYRYARAFKQAGVEDQVKIVKAFNEAAGDLGAGIGDVVDGAYRLPNAPWGVRQKVQPDALRRAWELNQMSPQEKWTAGIGQLAIREPSDLARPLNEAGSLLDPKSSTPPGGPLLDPRTSTPPGGSLATLESLVDTGRNANNYYEDSITNRAIDWSKTGYANSVVTPANIREVPPPGPSQLQPGQVSGPGRMVPEPAPGGPDRAALGEYRNSPLVDPKTSTPAGRLVDPNSATPTPLDETIVASDIKEVPLAPAAQEFPALPPRPAEPTVTPMSIREAVEEIARDAMGSGVDPSDAVRAGVKRLMPRTRVDQIEYVQQFTPSFNTLGVMNGTDAVWMNMVTNRGLREGWATIDPDTFQIRFNRSAAFELDQGSQAIKQAKAVDEAASLRNYDEAIDPEVLGPESKTPIADRLTALIDEMKAQDERMYARVNEHVDNVRRIIDGDDLANSAEDLADQRAWDLEEAARGGAEARTTTERIARMQEFETIRIGGPVEIERNNTGRYHINIWPLDGLNSKQLEGLGLSDEAVAGMTAREKMRYLKDYFDQVRETLPPGEYELAGNTAAKRRIYRRWFKDDPDVIWLHGDKVVGSEEPKAIPHLVVKEPVKPNPQAALDELDRQVVKEGVKADQLSAEIDKLRLSPEEIGSLKNQVDDEEIVDQFLGIHLDSYADEIYEQFYPQKAELGRGWEVYGTDGELIASARTKKAAMKIGRKEARAVIDETILKARQLADDATDQPLNFGWDDEMLHSRDVAGQLDLTGRQFDEIKSWGKVRVETDGVVNNRTIDEALGVDVTLVGKSARVRNIPMDSLNGIRAEAMAQLYRDDLPANTRRVLTNLMDKIDTQIKLLSPKARAQRQVQQTVDDAKRFLDHGDYC